MMGSIGVTTGMLGYWLYLVSTHRAFMPAFMWHRAFMPAAARLFGGVCQCNSACREQCAPATTGTLCAARSVVPHTCLQLIGALAEFKFGVTRWLLLHTNLFVAWLFNTVVSLLLVAGSSALVVGMAPAAISSGVPEVMAYLNGGRG
jgi:hypothetical protein